MTRKKKAIRVRGVLFDFDGTLTQPNALDFNALRTAIGCPQGRPVLEFIRSLADREQRKLATEILEATEMRAAADSLPNIHAIEIIRFARAKSLPVGIITRNSRASVMRALENFPSMDQRDFDIILTRDDPVNPKPSGDGIRLAARRFSIGVEEMMVVGDFIYDIDAGREAGAITVYLSNGAPLEALEKESDYTIAHLDELETLIRQGLLLPAGKFPNDLLRHFFATAPFNDPSLLIKPGVGEDTAAIDIADESVLILKSDPITFATDAIGHYAVLINANDIATAGAVPRWFLATLLFPCGLATSEVLAVMDELAEVCRSWGITLCGGHTEITDAVSRPLVIGMMAGTVDRAKLIDKRNMRPGDRVLLTKGVAVEGTAIIAQQFHQQLQEQGLSEAEITVGRGFIDRISILPEARIAAGFSQTSAMHDVTEGGLATALLELSTAGDHGLWIDMQAIPVYPECRHICNAVGIDPLGLIGSGSLLICCRPQASADLKSAIRAAGIDVADIGEVRDAPAGIQAQRHGRSVTWPRFDVDEITRLFA